ncbi:MAG: DUF3494 domain-containing protein [Deltaproteobacteria bacterium]|nr:DUF3494 domain-containing protein [Deltaproteobacteria bacterium]
MHRHPSRLRHVALALALCGLAACGDDNSNLTADANPLAPDATPNHPPNPDGLGPAPVALGGAADVSAPASYAVLAKTGITNVTGSAITGGNLGLSPAAASFITGFALVADPTNVFATSASVVAPGKIYASNYAAPTPTTMTTAMLAMQTAYTDAAGRTDPDFLNLGSGNLGGKTLAPGLYTWGTGVTIPSDVTIAGSATDTWIFQISNDLDVSSAKHVILSGGAQAKNVVWQVAGKVTVHATAHLEGVVLCKTGIALQTGASVNGRLFAQTLVALDDNAVTTP